MKLTSLALASLLLVGLASSAQAGVIYDNGAPNLVNANEMSAWVQAEDFTLGAAASLTRVEFWTLESVGAYRGSIAWQIYANTGGTPGSVLASGLAAAASRASTGGSAFGMSQFAYGFDVSPVALGAGSYFLALHNGALSNGNFASMYWGTTATRVGSFGIEDFSPFGSGGWSSNGQEHAFRLVSNATAVPEPATLALVGLALAGLGVSQRRKRG